MLYYAKTKFGARYGWPSFYDAADGAIEEHSQDGNGELSITQIMNFAVAAARVIIPAEGGRVRPGLEYIVEVTSSLKLLWFPRERAPHPGYCSQFSLVTCHKYTLPNAPEGALALLFVLNWHLATSRMRS